MHQLYETIQEAAAAVRKRWQGTPKVGIILGTGLGGLAEEIDAEASIPYADIPHFSASTAPSHAGRLVCGKLAGQTVVAMEGRLHFYEGFSPRQITFPVRVMKALGCEYLILSNAAGGLNPQYSKGDIMVIEDHIGLFMENPLRGPNDERLGIRFPDMSRPYDPQLVAQLRRIALEEGIATQQGVYVAVTGPNLETRAEYRALRMYGADAVGMSTIPEVIVATHAGMKCAAMSIITDMCLPDALEPAHLPDILAVAAAAEKKLRVLAKRLIASL
jgi:purine-nucleoside phosphorylase